MPRAVAGELRAQVAWSPRAGTPPQTRNGPCVRGQGPCPAVAIEGRGALRSQANVARGRGVLQKRSDRPER